jgi:hypothetical protein
MAAQRSRMSWQMSLLFYWPVESRSSSRQRSVSLSSLTVGCMGPTPAIHDYSLAQGLAFGLGFS